MEEIKIEDVMKLIKILSELDERTLITKIRIHFEELMDEDYVPPKVILKKEKYSEDEGSASSEEDFDVLQDCDGFLSIG